MELDELRAKALLMVDKAADQGILTSEEASYRRTALASARSFEEMDRHLEDLLSEGPSSSPAAAAPGTLSIPPRAASVLCIMGERRIRAPAMGDQTAALTVMGSTVLDLSGGIVDRPIILDTVTVMAETRIILPAGIPVDIRLLPVMGSVSEDRNLVAAHEGPRVIIQGVVVMGEVRIAYS